MDGPGDLVLVEQPGAEQQRVVRAEGHLRTGIDEFPQRHVRQLRIDAEPDVRRRAHLQRDAGVDDPLQQRWILTSPDAVSEPLRSQVIQAGSHAVRPTQLPAMWHREQAGSRGDPERRCECGYVATALVVGQPEADDPAIGVLRGEAGKGAGIERVSGPVGGDHDRDADAGCI